jgi:hypothetical protein
VTALLLMSAGAVLVVAALAAAVAHASRWAVGLAIAGEAVVGAGGLARGDWVVTAATWGTGAFLAWQWARLERKARRG